MPRYDKRVGLYHFGRWTTSVEFKHKGQAYLFHLLLNASKSHMGKREY